MSFWKVFGLSIPLAIGLYLTIKSIKICIHSAEELYSFESNILGMAAAIIGVPLLLAAVNRLWKNIKEFSDE